MATVLRAVCPTCQKPLNIPAEWVGQALRCKHCGSYLASRRKAPTAAAPLMAAPMAAAPMPSAPMPMPIQQPTQPAPLWEPLPEFTPPVAPAPTMAPLPAAYAQPTAWPTQPAPQAAVPMAGGYVSAFDTRDRYAGRGNYRGPKNRAWLKPAVFGVLFLALFSGAGIIYKMNPDLFKKNPEEEPPLVANNNDKGTPKNSGSTPGTGSESTSGIFPRRMLAISVHSYLYANSLHNGDTGFGFDDSKRTGTDAAIRKLAERWRVPKEQFYHLTDAPMIGEKKADPKGKDKAAIATVKQPPMKNVIEGTVKQFLESSREQDRIVLMYCGHAIEKGGEIYITPLEGDFEEPESLIPLKGIYEQLAACKAQEKVVIFDVCRFHPDRGAERPHAGPMSEALEKGLHEAPEGVSVITSCSKGEQSYELDYALVSRRYEMRGSFFVSTLHLASSEGALAPEGNKLPAPGDIIPVERLANYLPERIGSAVQERIPMGKTQTPKLTLKRKAEAVAYNPGEAVPARFEFPLPPPSADPKAVRELLSEIALPSVKQERKDSPMGGIPDVLPFRKEVLAEFLDDSKKPDEKFKKAIEEAVAEMRRLKEGGSDSELREEFGGETSEAAKKALQEDQKAPAIVEASLREVYDNLRAIDAMKANQPKRWQAHFDYVYSQVLYRICYVNQYNLALANVRTGKIPDLGEGQDGYRLTAETTLDKATVKEFKQWYDEAKKISNELAKNYAGTPWALLAKSDRTLALGLRVSPTALAKVTR